MPKSWIAAAVVALAFCAPLRAQSGDGALVGTRVKGTVLDVKGDTIRLRSARGSLQAYLLAPAAAQRARTVKTGSEIMASLDHTSAGQPLLLEILSVTPPLARVGNGTGPEGVAAARTSSVLVATDLACEVSVDFKKAATLPAGGHATLDLQPGERLLSAVAANGATWKQKVKVGGEQVVVEIVLAGAALPATRADFDRAAAAHLAALLDLRGAAGYVAWVLEKKSWGFHDVQLTVPLQKAQAQLERAQARLATLTPPDDARRGAFVELGRAAAEGVQGAKLLAAAVTAAQQDNSALGQSAQTRAEALAHLSLAAPDRAALAAPAASADFREALPADRWTGAGLAAHALDVRLGADYDGDSPPRLGAVEPGGLAATLGLRPGDRVVSIDGQAIADAWTLKQALHAAVGRSATLEIARDGKREKRKVTVPTPTR